MESVKAGLPCFFHQVIDVWGARRLALPFVVIGCNAITIYLLQRFVNFEALADVVFAERETRLHPVLLAGGALGLKWLVLYYLYRRRIFLRV